MAEDSAIELKHTTIVQYKAKGGAIKELRVIQPLNPDQRKMELPDIQLLAKEIAKVLAQDAF